REKWTVEPFAGIVKDGWVYGRGALDDKGMTTAFLEIFLLLHRHKVPLDRDIIFVAESGEEGTTHVTPRHHQQPVRSLHPYASRRPRRRRAGAGETAV
ncbi:MAG: M20/M25/M40 family metallo-hydrolase, partial [Verrucomicrobia bacterium]|nr:M20/M25/M40 family metallo-hydrolase [Verrucomicrobiota bacterium]